MNKYERLKYILPNIAILLLIAQFDFSTIKSYAFSILAMVIVAVIIYFSNYLGKSPFLFLSLMFLSSFFKLYEPIGHTFAIVTFFILIIYSLNGRSEKEFSYSDKVIGLMISVLVLFNVLGWFFKSVQEFRYLITSIINFFSFLLIFNLARKIAWNTNRIKVFFSLVCIMMTYAFITAIIGPFNIIPVDTPILKSVKTVYQESGTFFYSMIGRPSTAAGAMYAVLILPFLVTGNFRYVKLKGTLVFVGFISSILVCLMGFSKSHTVVLFFGLLLGLYLMIGFFSLRFTYAINLFSAVMLFAIFAYFSSSFINYSLIFKRFEKQPEIFKALINDPFKMKGTSREESFQMGLESLGRENWMIGYGYANAGQNRHAWLGEKLYSYPKIDFHNTYYSLPQLFGWAGAAAYLLLFLLTILRMRKIIVVKMLPMQYRLLSFSFMLFFIVHLLTEYSITALSSPHYMYMLFIMLGLANSLYYNYKKGMLGHK